MKEETNPRDFEKDLYESSRPSILIEWEKVFKKIWNNCTILWKHDRVSQGDFGTDVLIIDKTGRKYSVDIKTRRNSYKKSPFWVLEIINHIYYDENKTIKKQSSPGWLYKSTSDIILNGTLSEDKNKIIEVLGYTLTPFKNEEFKNKISKLQKIFANTSFRNGDHQTTVCVLASFDFLKEHANKFWYFKNETS